MTEQMESKYTVVAEPKAVNAPKSIKFIESVLHSITHEASEFEHAHTKTWAIWNGWGCHIKAYSLGNITGTMNWLLGALNSKKIVEEYALENSEEYAALGTIQYRINTLRSESELGLQLNDKVQKTLEELLEWNRKERERLLELQSATEELAGMYKEVVGQELPTPEPFHHLNTQLSYFQE